MARSLNGVSNFSFYFHTVCEYLRVDCTFSITRSGNACCSKSVLTSQNSVQKEEWCAKTEFKLNNGNMHTNQRVQIRVAATTIFRFSVDDF